MQIHIILCEFSLYPPYIKKTSSNIFPYFNFLLRPAKVFDLVPQIDFALYEESRLVVAFLHFVQSLMECNLISISLCCTFGFPNLF